MSKSNLVDAISAMMCWLLVGDLKEYSARKQGSHGSGRCGFSLQT